MAPREGCNSRWNRSGFRLSLDRRRVLDECRCYCFGPSRSIASSRRAAELHQRRSERARHVIEKGALSGVRIRARSGVLLDRAQLPGERFARRRRRRLSLFATPGFELRRRRALPSCWSYNADTRPPAWKRAWPMAWLTAGPNRRITSLPAPVAPYSTASHTFSDPRELIRRVDRLKSGRQPNPSAFIFSRRVPPTDCSPG